MMRQILFISICFVTIDTVGQVLPKGVLDLIPKGYEKMAFESGDLNNDGLIDYVVALNIQNEDSIFSTYDTIPSRSLIIFCMKSDTTFELKSRNDNIIFCLECGGVFGDPFAGLKVRNGSEIIVYHYGGGTWKWTHDLYFSFNPVLNTWILVKEVKTSFDSLNIDSTMKTTAIKQDTLNTIKFEDYKN